MAMEVMVDMVWAMARGLLRLTMAATDTAAMDMARGLLMLRLLLLPSQRLMLTTAMVATEDMEATAMAKGQLMLMLTMVAMDMAAMAVDTAAMAMARGPLMLT